MSANIKSLYSHPRLSAGGKWQMNLGAVKVRTDLSYGVRTIVSVPRRDPAS